MRTRKLHADDFFSPNKDDAVRPTTAPADAGLVDAHEFRVRMSPTNHETHMFRTGRSPTIGTLDPIYSTTIRHPYVPDQNGIAPEGTLARWFQICDAEHLFQAESVK